MPFRSPRMNRRILGFQRRVWCPKCTPESSSSCRVTSATLFFLPFGCSIPVVHPKATVRNHGNLSFNPPTAGEPNHDSRWAQLAPRVGVVMVLLQSRLRDLGVDLGRGETLVTEQFLDHAQVRATLQ